MARKKQRGKNKNKIGETIREELSRIHPEIKKSVWIVLALGVSIILILAAVGQAGPWGGGLYNFLEEFLGWGYYLLPLVAFILAFTFIPEEDKNITFLPILGGLVFIISGLGLIDIISPGGGGLTGSVVGALKIPFGAPASFVITATFLVVSFLVIINRPFRLNLSGLFKKKKKEVLIKDISGLSAGAGSVEPAETREEKKDEKKEELSSDSPLQEAASIKDYQPHSAKTAATQGARKYVFPPISLLRTTLEKPILGDLRANANIIKRTLESFSVVVEMGEINIGPTVTRYTLKPAEGVKLSRITALNQDLALALAAHPIRIEAPIPGKSFVGIEVPNKAAALVRLGSILLYPEFKKLGNLAFALGRNVSGEPIFADIAKMPHLLIAGSTGSGKSIGIHSLVISLLYKNSPDTLRLLMIDPKRVELSVYDGLPHLISPVVTDTKKSIGALKWVIDEMDRRYELLLEAGARDMRSYNANHRQNLPYLTVIIDELADLMTSYGREVEASVIRLAQMSRATGIHLIVSTQRPSVEVITGLIKANITSRVALQVASQVDSRTILDVAGAEKLLGSGDLLFISSEMSKPVRVQGAYISEEEVKKVLDFVRKNNPEFAVWQGGLEEIDPAGNGNLNGIDFSAEDDDELYGEAMEVVKAAGKASASLLQRRLKIGYARAARLLDIMEERGVVGPGAGAKPREVFDNK